MTNRSLTILSLSLVAVILWLAFKPSSTPETKNKSEGQVVAGTAQIEQLDQRISLLEQDLSDEIAARLALEERLALYEQTSTQSERPVTNTNSLSLRDNSSNQIAESNIEEATVEEKLIAGGMPSETIQAMKLTVDQNQLEMLQLRDSAIREGWEESVEFSEQMFALRNPYRGLKEEFGDEAYDLYLYATGTPNRVEIREVYSGSAADDAGIKPGDIFVSYASNPIYSMSTLRQSTLEGAAGETIMVELIRDNKSFTTSVPRGPLGISMSAAVVKPE